MTTSRAARSFPAIKRTMLLTLNWVLQNTENESVGLGLKIDFPKGGCSTTFSGLFPEHGLLGMVEVSHFQAIEIESPFH